MVSIPRGIHSYQSLRNRWFVSVLLLGGVSALAGYMLTSSLMLAAICLLFGQIVSFIDYFRLRKATDVWIEEMLSDLHIDVEDLDGHITPALVLEQWEREMKKQRTNPLMTRGNDERGFTPGILESELDSEKQYRTIEEDDAYEGLEAELSVAQQVKAEADQRYAEHAQERWEKAEQNDPDLIEAGVERLGDLIATDYFERNHEPNAVSKLMEDQSSNDES
jgi:hypothetical protein